jgi:hypothetical protein
MRARDLKASGTVLAAENGVYAIRHGSILLFYAVNEAEDYVILLDVVPAGGEPPTFETRERWESVDWEDLIKRLLLYASRQLQRGSDFRSRAALDASDYVLSAIEALLSGKRRFDGDKATLFSFLCGVISSLISHDIALTQAVREAHADAHADNIAAPGDIESDYMSREIAEKFIGSINDPQLREYAALRLDERYSTTSEYASALGVPEGAIYAMNRRLRRMRHLWAADIYTYDSVRRHIRRPEAEPPDMDPLDVLEAVRDLPIREIENELAELGIHTEPTLAEVADELAFRR